MKTQDIITVGRNAKCATVRRGRIVMSYPVWAVKRYTATNGTWELAEIYSGTTSGHQPSKKFLDDAKAFAARKGLQWMDKVTHGQLITE